MTGIDPKRAIALTTLPRPRLVTKILVENWSTIGVQVRVDIRADGLLTFTINDPPGVARPVVLSMKDYDDMARLAHTA
jgi:hypothetical protein